jgi:hypothetical protein
MQRAVPAFEMGLKEPLAMAASVVTIDVVTNMLHANVISTSLALLRQVQPTLVRGENMLSLTIKNAIDAQHKAGHAMGNTLATIAPQRLLQEPA